jgi:hypothetical protein
VPDEQALLIAIPLRHLETALAALSSEAGRIVLPAGGPGDLDEAASGSPVLVMPTDTDDDSEISAATWRATFVRRVPHDPGTPWPDGLPTSWTDEHPAPVAASADVAAPQDVDESDEDGDDQDDQDDPDAGPQSFLEVVDLGPLRRQDWLFANELVGKQARGGRYFRPRVPTLVNLPD